MYSKAAKYFLFFIKKTTKCMKPLVRNRWRPQQTKLCSERGALCGRRRETSPSRSVFAEVSLEREREPIPVRGNKLRDDKPFSMDDEATEERRWFLNLSRWGFKSVL